MTTHTQAPVHTQLRILMPNPQSTSVQSVPATDDAIMATINAQIAAFTLPLLACIEQYVIIYNQRLGEHGSIVQVSPGRSPEHALYGEIDNFYVDRHVGAPHQSEFGSMVWITREQWDAYMPF